MTIKTSVFFGPIYPTVKKDNLLSIIDKFIETGVSYIMIDKLNFKPGIKKNIELKLEKNPEILNIYREKSEKRQETYLKIREKIKRIGFEKNIKIIDAFNQK